MNRYEQARDLANYFEFYPFFQLADDQMLSRDLPYHNWFHTCCMICNCIEGAQAHDLSFRECHLIGLSALFHDFNHSGGKKIDAENINVAISNLLSVVPQQLGYNFLDVYQMRETIRVTQYPFIYTPKTIEQKIIRDVDLMQILEPEWYEHVILGLQAEFKRGGRDYSHRQMLTGQLDFLDKHIPNELFTSWGRAKFDGPRYKDRLEKINRMLDAPLKDEV